MKLIILKIFKCINSINYRLCVVQKICRIYSAHVTDNRSEIDINNQDWYLALYRYPPKIYIFCHIIPTDQKKIPILDVYLDYIAETRLAKKNLLHKVYNFKSRRITQKGY